MFGKALSMFHNKSPCLLFNARKEFLETILKVNLSIDLLIFLQLIFSLSIFNEVVELVTRWGLSLVVK